MRLLYLHRGRLSAVAGLLLAAIGATPSAGYKISVLGRVHERMTRLAEQCDRAGPADTEGLRCALPADRSAFSKVDWKRAENRYTVRWPDDPTDQALTTGGLKFVVTSASTTAAATSRVTSTPASCATATMAISNSCTR
ncbi:hypothetical protein ASF00_17680 [Sphingomonas sp. Leaf34]|nr:hypothetical protein ASF00_17680 [Sphingomonas sp. Leaf34]